MREIDRFSNQFPSGNDLNAYADFAQDAIANGAELNVWARNFQAIIIGADDISREYDGFSSYEDSDGNEFLVNPGGLPTFAVIPDPETPVYQAAQNYADQARNDAANNCGG